MASKKISQQELRQMMKERQRDKQKASSAEVTKKAAAKKVESPLARYETNGRLSCIVCNEYISSDHLWSLHIGSKSHKSKLEDIKRKRLSQMTSETKINAKVEKNSDTKREEVKQAMKRKVDSNDNTVNQKIAKHEVKEERSDSMEIDDKSDQNIESNKDSTQSGVPNDFFDGPKQPVEAPTVEQLPEANDSEEQMESETSSLPKGFFDDPIKDAKARKVVYKNPIDEQWEEFQKVIAEENNVSENIIEEEVEELQNERNIDEIEEQIANWIKVNEMQKRAEILHNHIANSRVKEEDSDSDVDEQDLDAFSNWRSRTALNSK